MTALIASVPQTVAAVVMAGRAVPRRTATTQPIATHSSPLLPRRE
jgi:hypothetical protein